MFKKIIFFLIIFSLSLPLVFCDRIILKSGRIIEAMIIEKADTYVKAAFEGVELTFYNDEIKEIIPGKEKLAIDLDKYEALAKAALVDKALEAEELKIQLEQVYLHVMESYSQHSQRVSPGLYEKGKTVTSNIYNPQKLYQEVRQYFIKNFNREYLQAVVDFYNTDLAKKIIDLEAKASSGDSVEKLEKFADELSTNPLPKARTELAKRLDEVTDRTSLQLKIMVVTFSDIAQALNPLLAPDKQLREGELEAVKENMMDKLKPVLDNAVSISFLYAYQPLSDDELQRYIDFWLSDGGRWFIRNNEEAVTTAINKSGGELISAFKALADKKQDKPPEQEKDFKEISLPNRTGGLYE